METRTSQAWWDSIKDDPAKINEWLAKQYRGEVQAVRRLRQYINYMPWSDGVKSILKVIMQDEANHAHWIGNLLKSREISPQDDSENAENRYWSAMDLDGIGMDEVLAVGAHAESMRLERIRVLCQCPKHPDIQAVFTKILVDEEFHAAAFKKLASPEALEKTKGNHRRGLELLGLGA